MTPFFFRASLVVVALAFLGKDSKAQTRTLTGHVPAAVTHLTAVDRLSGSARLSLTIGLPLKNQQALTNLLGQIYNHGDPNYRHYLTPQEFTDRFGPSESDYEKVVAFAESNGLAVVRKHPNRMLVSVTGSVADIERAFHVRMMVYPHPEEARTFYAPDVEPSPNLAVPILHIAGLDNYSLPRPAGLHADPFPPEPAPVPNGGSGSGGSYLGSDFRNAYAPGVALDGSGQSVGLLEFDGYYSSDITNYERLAGYTNTIANTIITNVLLDQFLGAPGPNNDEVALDIELTLSMAPGLSQVIVYEAGPQGSADDMLNRMATDNLAAQLGSSWTWGTGDDPNADQIFQEFAAQGQSFFNASGDVDAYGTSIPFPADNPYITVVGGTTLSTASNKLWSSETVWNMNNGQGSSGGISARYAIPAWQQGLNLTNSQGSAAYRNLPDVAMVANQIWVIYNNGGGAPRAGTSCAAPLWTAFMALVNQQGAAYGQAPAGFINPAIYAIGQRTNYTACFNDITTGSNTNSINPNRFFASPGYDLCTGWGTPAGQPLIDALQPPDYLVILPQTGFTTHGLPGGPFHPTAQTFSVTNAGPTPLTWAAGTASAWLDVSPTNGALPFNSPATQVAVNVNAAVYALATGTYGADVWFTNQTTGIVRSRHFTLQISPAIVQNGGFETGDFTDWTLNGNVFVNSVSSGSPIAGYAGKYAAALGQGFSLGYLSQSLTTSPGQAYLLSLWLENPQSGTPNQFLVDWNTNAFVTNTIFNQANMNSFAWTNLQFIVVAAGPSSTLAFGFRDDPAFLGLDDISLTPIPTPAPTITATNAGSIAFSWATLPGVIYQVQYQSNLSQTNWQNLGPAMVATNGSLFISDPISLMQNRFYRVVVSP